MKLIRFASALTTAVVLLGGAAVMAPATAQAATQTCSSSTPVANRPTLLYGDTGSCVTVAQSLLLKKGYSLGGYTANGIFGPNTLAAVKLFQSRNGLSSDGVVGPLTWKKLAGTTTSAPAPAPTTYNIYKGPNYTSRVVLTFDDCPRSLSAFKATVQAAKKLGIGLVLAPTGDCIKSGRFSASYAQSYGHYVINHSVTHADLTRLSYSSVLTQLSSPGVVTNYGRPPYGAYNTTVKNAYAAKGMRMWLWNVDTRDWDGPASQSTVIKRAVGGAYKGSTVLMHMQHNGFNATALSQIKSGLASRGLSVCRPASGATSVKLPGSLPC
jgi:peptidoglycan/xylan/chitin deacetylase (PgdA/CDA1 family)